MALLEDQWVDAMLLERQHQEEEAVKGQADGSLERQQQEEQAALFERHLSEWAEVLDGAWAACGLPPCATEGAFVPELLYPGMQQFVEHVRALRQDGLVESLPLDT